ncbi:MAG: cation:proton antiporter [Akkermansiaceae bacterium]
MIHDFTGISFGTYLTIILGLGILAQWSAWRFKLPSILLLLAFGFGAQLLFSISINDFLNEDLGNSLLLPVVGLSVALILFEGGLTLKFSELKESGAPVFRLCTIGVLIAFVLTTAIGIYIFQWNWRVAGILGSILVVTGPTVIAPLIRHIKPSRKVGSIVKWEGIVVDPIGAIMAVLIFQAAIAGDWDSARTAVITSLLKTLVVGVGFAFVLAKAVEFALKKHYIPDFLHSVFMISVIAIAFSASNAVVHESGLLTVTVMGIALANQKAVSVKHILEFKEHLRVLIISLLFLVLSGRVNTETLTSETLTQGLILLALLILVVRPLSIFGANLFSNKTTFKEQIFLASLAPRGIVAAAVTSIFALELTHAAAEGQVPAEVAQQAENLVLLTFIVIVGTVAFYGLLAAPLANKLGLATKNPRGILFAGANTWTRLIAKTLHDDGHDVLMLDTNFSNVAAASLAGIPAKRANILSEYVEEELDLTGIGQLVAATNNDEVNSLAAKEFTHIFGSAEIWQVAPLDDKEHHTNSVASHQRGRIMFTGRPNRKKLERLVLKGAIVKKTSISEQYTFQHFTEANPDAIILFLNSEDKGLRPAEEDLKKVTPGNTIYALVFPEDPEPLSKKPTAPDLSKV